MTKTSLAVLALLTALVAAIAACEDDHDHDTAAEPPSCKAIVEACHELDKGDGPIHDCHEFAEGGKTEAECAAKKTECLTTCTPGGDAG